MLTTLTILSLDQGKIYKAAPPFEGCDERRTSGIDFDLRAAQSAADMSDETQTSQRQRTIGFVQFLRWMLFPATAPDL